MRGLIIMKIFCFSLAVCFLMSGCGKTYANEENMLSADITEQAATAAPDEGTQTVPPTAEPTPTEEKKSPLMENDTGKTIISKANYDTMYNTTYMIVSKNGTVILTDPIQILDGIKADIITVSHSHSDHYDGTAKQNEDGITSMYSLESFTHKEIEVTAVVSSHNSAEPNEKSPSNVIYAFEVDGLRIAHMGDVGQKELSDSQLEELGELDIVFIPCIDMPEYGLTLDKTIKILSQLQPKIAIPTHFDARDYKGFAKLEDVFDKTENVSFRFSISPADLDEGASRFIRLK